MMSEYRPPGRRQALQRAVSWLSEQPRKDRATLEAACRRFDLSPRDAEYLLSHFREAAGDSARWPRG